ncbi:WhiB family transcriptional regulator [Candidatus Saccharibacteria bacterium]|nr:WhiB family transcriptional regulator [Candidatus Saccharibacteria bacterium]
MKQAKTVCGRCAVRQACLAFGKSASLGYGVWGAKNYNRYRS